MDEIDAPVYEEILTSPGTSALFLLLAGLFFALFYLGISTNSRGYLAYVWLFFGLFFVFYLVNYRQLILHIDSRELRLKFGLFSFSVPLETIAFCRLDDLSLWRVGGAGIHFTWIRKRYRMFFNFLEHPRLVVGLKEKRGRVRDLVFSTRRPERILKILQKKGILEKEADWTGPFKNV